MLLPSEAEELESKRQRMEDALQVSGQERQSQHVHPASAQSSSLQQRHHLLDAEVLTFRAAIPSAWEQAAAPADPILVLLHSTNDQLNTLLCRLRALGPPPSASARPANVVTTTTVPATRGGLVVSSALAVASAQWRRSVDEQAAEEAAEAADDCDDGASSVVIVDAVLCDDSDAGAENDQSSLVDAAEEPSLPPPDERADSLQVPYAEMDASVTEAAEGAAEEDAGAATEDEEEWAAAGAQSAPTPLPGAPAAEPPLGSTRRLRSAPTPSQTPSSRWSQAASGRREAAQALRDEGNHEVDGAVVVGRARRS